LREIREYEKKEGGSKQEGEGEREVDSSETIDGFQESTPNPGSQEVSSHSPASDVIGIPATPKRGRKLKFDSLSRLKLALTTLKGSSLSAAGEISAINSCQTLEELKELSSPSRSTVVQVLCELFFCYKLYFAWLISTSSSIAVVMDTTTDSHREVLGIFFAALSGFAGPWAHTLGVVEIQGHKADSQVAILRRTLGEINKIQNARGWRETKIYEVASLTADNTGSNTGEKGVRGLLEKERQKEWREDGKLGECPPLLFKGCEDHIVHLASTELEKRIIARALSWQMTCAVEKKRHVSATAVCHIVARIRSNLFYRAFRAFAMEKEGRRPKFSRYSETRYASVNIISLEYLRSEKLILWFLRSCRTLLTDEDIKALKVLLDPEMRAILRVRAVFAQKVLLPIMGISAKATDPEEHKRKLEHWEKAVRAVAVNPALLASIDDATLKIAPAEESLIKRLKEEMDGAKPCSLENPSERWALEAAGIRTEDLEKKEKGEGEEEEEERQEESEPSEIQRIHSNSLQSQAPLTLERPSPIATSPPPPLDKRILTLVADAAKAYLYESQKHNGGWKESEVDFFLPTSRAAERLFSFVKEYLESNPDMRTEVLNSFLALHDLPVPLLVKIWETFWDPSVPSIAAEKLKDCPKISEVDQFYLEQLKKRVEKEERKDHEKLKTERITSILQERGVLKEGEKYLKRHLETAFGEEKLKKLREAKEDTSKKALENLFLRTLLLEGQ